MKPNEKEKAPKTRGKRRGSKPYMRKEDASRDDRRSVSRSSANDPAWYLVNGQLAQNVASFSFNTAVGDTVKRMPMDFGSIGMMPSYNCLPGIAAIYVGPSIGVSNWENSPINVAAKDIYSFVRHANSGHSNYDPADLMLYLLAADSVQMFWSYMVRAYGTMKTFSQRNRYIGDALITAMGLNPSDFRANIAQFAAYINQFAIKASVLAVPNTMTYYMRHNWMFQNIYMDEDTAKAQLYMYVPAFVYKYHINSGTSAGELIPEWVALGSNSSAGSINNGVNSNTFAQIKVIGDNILNAMLSQEDVGIMSGDILKAYGSEKLYRFAQVDTNYAVAPIFSEEVLAQIHNTDFIGGLPGYLDANGDIIIDADTALTITQNTSIGSGLLMFEPAFAATLRNCYPKYLDFWKEDVSPEIALVASRNKVMCAAVNRSVKYKSGNAYSGKAATLQTCGSEIAFDVAIWKYDPVLRTLSPIRVYANNVDTVNANAIPELGRFNEFPIVESYSNLTVGPTYGEFANYTVLDFTDINDMHNTALLSMFGVPYKW